MSGPAESAYIAKRVSVVLESSQADDAYLHRCAKRRAGRAAKACWQLGWIRLRLRHSRQRGIHATCPLCAPYAPTLAGAQAAAHHREVAAVIVKKHATGFLGKMRQVVPSIER